MLILIEIWCYSSISIYHNLFKKNTIWKVKEDAKRKLVSHEHYLLLLNRIEKYTLNVIFPNTTISVHRSEIYKRTNKSCIWFQQMLIFSDNGPFRTLKAGTVESQLSNFGSFSKFR